MIEFANYYWLFVYLFLVLCLASLLILKFRLGVRLNFENFDGGSNFLPVIEIILVLILAALRRVPDFLIGEIRSLDFCRALLIGLTLILVSNIPMAIAFLRGKA